MSAVIPMGRFADLPVESPQPGVTRTAFNSAHSTVTRYRFEPGASFPRHRHPQEQITLVEDGSGVFTLGEELIEAAAGDWLVIPGDVVHSFTAAAPAGATLLCVVTPRRGRSDEYQIVG